MRATEGPEPTANAASVGPGGSITVSASSKKGGCAGGFVLKGSDVQFAVSYTHVKGASATVTAKASAGYVWGTDAATYSGRHVTTRLDLYKGVPTGNGSYAIPLILDNESSDNCQDFVNSLFGPNRRTVRQIEAADGNKKRTGYLEPVDFTGGQLPRIVDVWTRRWLDREGGRCPRTDAELLEVIARYITSASADGKPLSLWLPQIEQRARARRSVFRLAGYRKLSFLSNDGRWNARTVTGFLTLLAAGAHFVAISATDDLPSGASAQSFDDAVTAARLPTRQNLGDSRCYSAVTNLTSRYYLGLNDDIAPAGCGLILAFVIGRTIPGAFPIEGSFNTFFQLEGWPSGTARYNGDNTLRKATRWAVSTFGASPYSEMRGTTIFLAPRGWIPQVYRVTHMMPYVGAYAINPDEPTPPFWLDTALVEIPGDAPALPGRYIR